MYYNPGFLALGFRQILIELFTKPSGFFDPGVEKFSWQDGTIDYILSPEIVGWMTRENYFQRLKESGFLKKRDFSASLEEGGVISLTGTGFHNSHPWIVFSEDGVWLEVPRSRQNGQDWDNIVLDMRALFGGLKETAVTLIPGIKVIKRPQGSASYLFLPEIVKGMAPEEFTERLERSNLLGDFDLVMTCTKKNEVITLDGAGVSSSYPPRIIFLGERIRLEVFFSQHDKRIWDHFAERMGNLFLTTWKTV